MSQNLSEQGLKDGIASLGQIRAIVHERLQAAEAALRKAEQDVTELRKLDSFAVITRDAYRARLAAIETAKG